MCSSNDDNHGDFPHRLVIPFTTRVIKGENGPEPHTVMGEAFVICAHCDHWVNRSVTSCHCRERCHEKAAAAARERYRIVTKQAKVRGR